ncbi:MAG: flagellar hook-associated protein FlgK [Lachnospiraceae bacterium]|jgi:flagellar hook-associated protein 1 FlgK|nr:flagellar hook-associated protein FlgK [Lachnospiraceae bacterium]
MPSTFLGLNTGYTGLVAANAALNTTANNIANVNTEGYSRQLVTQTAATAIRTYARYGCMGAGVDTESIDRQRDSFYDYKYWNNNASVGEYSVIANYMKQMEDHFKSDKTVRGFTEIYNQMCESLQEVMKNADSKTTKTQFIGYAQNLSYYFNTMAQTLEKMQLDINSEIKNVTDSINTHAAEIASLNKQINVVELTGVKANELRDKRDHIIDQLSELVDVKCLETPVYDTNQPDRETGATRFQVQIAGGQKLVDGSDYYQLECVARAASDSINQSDATGLFDIKWKDGRNFYMYNQSIGGALRGLIEMRDGNNQENFRGYVQSATEESITIRVEGSWLKDLDKAILNQSGALTADAKLFYYDSFEADYGADGEIVSYTFHLDPAKPTDVDPTEAKVGQEAFVGYSIDYQGIPYYQEQMNEWCRNYARVFNKIVTQDGAVDGYGNEPQAFFVAFNKSDNTQIVPDENASNVKDTFYCMTAGNFSINKYLLDDPELFPTHTGETKGVSAYDVVEDLIDLRTNKDKMEFRGCSSEEFLQCILADISLNASNANTFSTTFENIALAIDNQRESISGVDEDEEALNLVSYQHAYSLASKVIQVMKEVYDRLILQTGV